MSALEQEDLNCLESSLSHRNKSTVMTNNRCLIFIALDCRQLPLQITLALLLRLLNSWDDRLAGVAKRQARRWMKGLLAGNVQDSSWLSVHCIVLNNQCLLRVILVTASSCNAAATTTSKLVVLLTRLQQSHGDTLIH